MSFLYNNINSNLLYNPQTSAAHYQRNIRNSSNNTDSSFPRSNKFQDNESSKVNGFSSLKPLMNGAEYYPLINPYQIYGLLNPLSYS